MKKYYHEVTESNQPSNKGFGVTFGVLFFIIFLFKFYFSQSFNQSITFLIISSIFFILSYTKPNSLFLLNRLWNKFGFFLSRIFNPIFLFLCYCFIIIPTSLFMKLFFSYDSMNLRKIKKSLWIERKEKSNTNDLKDQF